MSPAAFTGGLVAMARSRSSSAPGHHANGDAGGEPCVLHALMEAIASASGARGSGVLEDALRRALGADDVQVLAERVGDNGGPDARWYELAPRGARLGWLRVRGGDEAHPHAQAAVLAAALALERRGAGPPAPAADDDRLMSALASVAIAASRERDRAAVASVLVAEAAQLGGVEAAAVLMRGAHRRPAAVAASVGPSRQAWPAGLAAMASGRVQSAFAGQTGVPLKNAAGGVEGALVAAGAGPLGAETRSRLIMLAHCASLACAHVDLRTELETEQARRGALAAALVDAQERERGRVAEDLHDGPVQELSGLALMLDALAADLTLRDGDADAVAGAARAARQAIGSIRRAIHDLHPVSVQDRGFSVAVRTTMERLGHRGMTVELVGLDVADHLPRDARTAAFRAVQEALANAVRHSRAQTLRVEGRRILDDVVLEVHDDGIGFDPGSAPPRTGDRRTHLGLVVLHERTKLCGGEVVLTSRPGKGTRVRMRFPVTGETPVY